MQIMKFATNDDRTPHVGVVHGDELVAIGRGEAMLTELLHSHDPFAKIRGLLANSTRSFPIQSIRVLAPLDEQEVWGAGVTYERSKVARELESDQAASFYDLVYRADRPELFFKATPDRKSTRLNSSHSSPSRMPSSA